METLKKFLEALRTDPKAAELMKGKEKPETFEEIVKVYAEAAKELGFALAEDDLKEGIKALEEEQKAKTEQAKEAAQELDADELNKVAGGAAEKCRDTFEDQENCWFQDGCDINYNWYDTYNCHVTTKLSQ